MLMNVITLIPRSNVIYFVNEGQVEEALQTIELARGLSEFRCQGVSRLRQSINTSA